MINMEMRRLLDENPAFLSLIIDGMEYSLR